MKKSLMISLALGAVAFLLYFLAVEPAEDALRKARGEHAAVECEYEAMRRNLGSAELVEERLRKLDESLAPFRSEMLEPLLESYAMAAKSIADPIAIGAGISETEYFELPILALPLPKRQPKQLHARCPVRICAQGSYQAFTSFLRQLEAKHPLVTLQSVTVTAQSNPELQKLEFVLEWPTKGELIAK